MCFPLGWICLIIFLAPPKRLIGQQTQHYTGPFQIGDYRGNAVYDYKVIGQDTLLEGAFQMQRSDLEALLKKEDSTFLFSGSFQDGYPNGFWTFQFGEFQSERRAQVINYQYRVQVSGVQESGSGTVLKGKPNGTWTYDVNRIQDSEIVEALFKSTFDFDEGVPQRNFRIESEDRTLVGRFLRNGIAHDEWALYDDAAIDATERWFFQDGVLQKIILFKNGKASEFPIYASGSQVKTVTIDTRYLAAVQLQAAISDPGDAGISGILDLLDKNATYYAKMDGILSELGTADFNPEFKVKLPYFPLDSLEKRTLANIFELHEKARTSSDFFLNSSQLNILKLTDQQSNYLFEVVRALSNDFLKPVQKVLNFQKDSVLEFVPRARVRKELWPVAIPSKTVRAIITKDSVTVKKPFTLSNAADYDFEGRLLNSLYDMTKYAMACLDSIEKDLNEKLIREKRQQTLVALEEKLVLQEKGFGELLDSLSSDTPANYRKVLQRLKGIADTKLGAYGVLQDTDLKLEQGKELTHCFEKLLVLGAEIGKLPAQSEEIRLHYQDGVWNPFMATVMNEEVKKRITNAYRKVLVPYFLNQIQDGFDCGSVELLLEEMSYTGERMFQLRDEETSKLERKLRREQDPKTVLKLFHKQPKNKEN